MTAPRILIPQEQHPARPNAPPNVAAGWRWLAWFGALLVIAGLGDIALTWYPLMFGNAQWEFGTVAATFQGLPILAIGFAALLSAALSLGNRRLIGAVGIGLLLLTMFLTVAGVIFLLDVPLALQAGQGPAALAIKKAIVKTLMLGVLFGGAFLAGGIAALRQLRNPQPV